MMGGYVTWIGVLGCVCLCIYNLYEANMEQAIAYFAMGAGLLGLGRKIEKANGGLK